MKHGWGDVLAEARLSMTRASFDTHLAGSVLVDEREGEWTIGLRSSSSVEWVGLRLARTLEAITKGVVGQQISLRFVIGARWPVPAGATGWVGVWLWLMQGL